MPEVRLPRLQGRDIPFGARCVYCGSSGDGKTNTMLDVLYQNRHDDDALLQSGCAQGGDAESELAVHFPAVYVTNTALRGVNWDRVKRGIRRCILRSEKIVRENRLRRLAHRRPLRQPRTHVIFEDCAFDKSIRGSAPLTYLFQVGRRYVRAIHVTLQRITGLHPDQRRQCSYIFMMYTAVPAARREMYEEYVGKNKELTFEQFCGIMDGLRAYQALVFMPQLKAPTIWDRFAYYSAPLRRHPWRFGRPAYWRAHRQWYDPTYFKRELDELLTPGGGGGGKGRGKKSGGVMGAVSAAAATTAANAKVTVTLDGKRPKGGGGKATAATAPAEGHRR